MAGLKIHAGVLAPGLLLEGDVLCLREHAAKVPEDGQIVELGSLFGCSAIVLAQSALPFTDIWCVDLWEKPIGLEPDVLVGCDPFDVFMMYMRDCAVHPLRMDSVVAASNFDNEIVDLLFVDAGHGYDQVLADLRAWWPKMKCGGVVLGHDGISGSEVERAAREFAADINDVWHPKGKHFSIEWPKYTPPTYGMYKMVKP